MRKKPYTVLGLKRIKCSRCGQKPSYSSWSICSNGNDYQPLCLDCDIALNDLVLEFMKDPNRFSKMEDYKQKAITDYQKRMKC